MERKPYPTDVSDKEWAFIAPYLTFSHHFHTMSRDDALGEHPERQASYYPIKVRVRTLLELLADEAPGQGQAS
jgi:hypothetical protein